MRRDLAKEFGRALRELRQARRLTQEALSERVEISVEYLSRIERGLHKSPPSWSVLERLGRALGVVVEKRGMSWTIKLAA
ncbi:MAG: helix-turn-helix domain-containing protein [Blastocatellia bacterium]|nr:helix-turn-helix domain-containing protein [Blastocatellia bacterium]MCS7157732.1 helix-turn-helix domain-containing protein [Blastocatellia bacterium]MCX7751997.1 helix-turn-helix domain-containing protein [Blastocatellia bacterium]MDW8167103.1 helix-turn-helix transcriptional regulator [Acidobacteriota bacterium]MDW8257207.1 helix-turn-helix transcriptional regulator [Acidobacteriota bacterium]